jgi:THO complex subunit 4
LQKLNGLLVDGRPIKIEIVVGAAQVDKIIPTAKTLAERTTQPKNQPKAQPKSAAADKKKAAGPKGAAAKGAAAKKPRGRNARPSKKTAEELDSDMADYFTPAGENAGAPAAAAAAPAAPAAGEAMEEIM